MAAIVHLRQISLAFGGPLLLDKVDCQINTGERIGLVGRNGMGKSTLLKVIQGQITPDSGSVEIAQHTVITSLAQTVDPSLKGSVFSVVASGLSEVGALLSRYQDLSHKLSLKHDEKTLEQLHDTQQKIEDTNGFQLQTQVDKVISHLSLNADDEFSRLSGGMKRRVLLACALVAEPKLLLLDEPTNHLDMDAIVWLENFLKNYAGSIVLITHDRQFLQNCADRILDLDRGKLTDWPGDYHKYLAGKQHLAEVEQEHNALFDKKLAKEETWIRQGVKARRTRNEGRVRALEQLRQTREKRRERTGTSQLALNKSQLSGKRVLAADDVSYTIDSHDIIKRFSVEILRGDKIGILGPNGCGKTTLIKLLLGELEATSGSIELGTGLDIAYFDQHRSQLDETKSIQDNVGQGRETITINGKSKHVLGYLQDFLFSPQQARAPITKLSGGERNRAMLAKLFTQPANVIIMDEPTNDLDIETLELLESLLVEFTGTLLIVSHDRIFLNNVVTSTIAFEGNGTFHEYVGGYDDYLRQKKKQKKETEPTKVPEKTIHKKTMPQSKKLSYKERYELEQLPKKIEALEIELQALREQTLSPSFYKQPQQDVKAITTKLSDKQDELNNAYKRWESLEG